MYGINKNTQEGKPQPIPAGINENVTFNGATFSKLSDDKEPVLQYHFTDSQGRTLSHTMWPVDVERVKKNATDYPKEHARDNNALGFVKGQIITPDEAVIIAANDFNAYNKHILNRFFTDQEIIDAHKDVNSYATFAQATVKLCESKNEFPLVRLKVVLDWQEKYNVLPKKHYNAFIELQSVEPSGLQITQYDKITPSKPTENNPDGFTTDDFQADEFNAEDATF